MKQDVVNRFYHVIHVIGKKGLENQMRGALSKSEFAVMFVLQRLEEEQAVASTAILSEWIGVGKSAISQIINSLEEKGHVVRRVNQNDRRLFDVSLTDEGRALLVEQQQRMQQFIGLVLQRLGEQKVETLIDLLEDYGAILEELEM